MSHIKCKNIEIKMPLTAFRVQDDMFCYMFIQMYNIYCIYSGHRLYVCFNSQKCFILQKQHNNRSITVLKDCIALPF